MAWAIHPWKVLRQISCPYANLASPSSYVYYILSMGAIDFMGAADISTVSNVSMYSVGSQDRAHRVQFSTKVGARRFRWSLGYNVHTYIPYTLGT